MDMEDQDLFEPPDFDFFESPRKGDGSRSPMDFSPHRDTEVAVTSKPPSSSMKSPQHEHQHGESFSYSSHIEQKLSQQKGSTHSQSSESDSETDSVSSYSSNDSRQSETDSTRSSKDVNNHYHDYDDHVKLKDDKVRPNSPEKRDSYSSCSASSSAYSDGSSDEETPRKQSPNVYERVRRDRTPQFNKREAWSAENEVDNKNGEYSQTSVSRQNEKQSRPITFKKESKRTKSGNNSLGSDSDCSVSEVSDSDMTDVSPLASPEPSPPVHRKNKHVTITDGDTLECRTEKNLEHHHTGDVLLKTSQIDMSLLMHAVSEIEKERQDRIKANTRRVMFAPSKKSEKENYSFDSDRTQVIEKENQRLLKELMKHISKKHKDVTVKAVDSSPSTAGRRPTTSALNRRKDQQRIDMENWGLLNRLQRAKPTKGLSKSEQLTDYQRTVRYGAPSSSQRKLKGTLSAYENSLHIGSRTQSMSSINSAGSARRGRCSRPSSAKSQTSVSTTRPSSAKSCTSVSSIHSQSSVENRPAWNDRFSYT